MPPGAIELDGQDIRAYAAAGVRARMAVISQSTYLFTATLAQNLRLARPSASDADLRAALHAAELDEWLAGQPNGLGEWLGAARA